MCVDPRGGHRRAERAQRHWPTTKAPRVRETVVVASPCCRVVLWERACPGADWHHLRARHVVRWPAASGRDRHSDRRHLAGCAHHRHHGQWRLHPAAPAARRLHPQVRIEWLSGDEPASGAGRYASRDAERDVVRRRRCRAGHRDCRVRAVRADRRHCGQVQTGSDRDAADQSQPRRDDPDGARRARDRAARAVTAFQARCRSKACSRWTAWW